MSKQGYVLIARGLLEHPRFRPRGSYSEAEAWLWLINAAAFKPKQVAIFVGRQRRVVDLERGQLCHAIRFLAEKWGWGVNRVQRFLRDLTDDGTIETQTNDGQTIITLCNYRTWQDQQDACDTETDTLSHTETDTQTDIETDRQTDTKKKQLKQLEEDIGRSEKSEGSKPSRSKVAGKPEGFDEWYAAYPRKMKPLDAAKAYAQTMASGRISRPELLARTVVLASQWARRPKADIQFCPYPAAWLRAGSYDDETVAPKATTPPTPRQRPEDFSTAHWRNVVEVWRQERSWAKEAWGPAPGEPGCLVPQEILGPVGGAPNAFTH